MDSSRNDTIYKKVILGAKFTYLENPTQLHITLSELCSFVSALLALLGVLDLYFINHAYYSTLTKGASVQLVFGFEVNVSVWISSFCQLLLVCVYFLCVVVCNSVNHLCSILQFQFIDSTLLWYLIINITYNIR